MKKKELSFDLTVLAGGLKRDLDALAAGPPAGKKKPPPPFAGVLSAVRDLGNQVREVQKKTLATRRKHLVARADVVARSLTARKEEVEHRVERRQQAIAVPKEDGFVVAGRVLDVETGTGLAGVRVEVSEREPSKDDVLGGTVTDDFGFYRLEFHRADFEDLFERQPETYIRIYDDEGEAIHTSDRSLRHRVGEVEILHAAVDGGLLPHGLKRGRQKDQEAAAELLEVAAEARRLDARGAIRVGLLTRAPAAATPAADIDIGKIEGVGKVFQSRLQARGVYQAAEVSKMPTVRLARLLEVAEARAEKIKIAAQRLVHTDI